DCEHNNLASYLTTNPYIQPRRIRVSHAPYYLGMDRKVFNQLVRPTLTEFVIGKQGIVFDRLDLDAWVDDHKIRSGRPAVRPMRGKKLWDAKHRQASLNEAN